MDDMPLGTLTRFILKFGGHNGEFYWATDYEKLKLLW